jgi:hypothetical protein
MGAHRQPRLLWPGLLALACALAVPTAAQAGLTRIAVTNEGGGSLGAEMVRTADGTLHLVYATQTGSGDSADGIGALSINSSGRILPAVQALSGWKTGTPGLVVMPGGTLEAVFAGAPDVGGTGYGGPWGITSPNGGSSWASPVDVGSHSMEAFGGDVTARMSGSTPVLTLAASGGIVVQDGFGPGSPTYQINAPDGPFGGVGSTLDAGSGDEVVASWYSLENGSGLWMQGVSPNMQSQQEVASNFASWGDQARQLTVASLDNGPGVYAAYSPDGRHVSLTRYGGGTVRVASVGGLQSVQVGAATGTDGRLWVIWGGQNKTGQIVIKLTRSNKARTRFEPVQSLTNPPGGLERLYGDGRLGPLDLLANMTPNVRSGPTLTGVFYARALPELSTSVSIKRVGQSKFTLSVKVTDAGDPVTGASDSANGHRKRTSTHGTDKLTLKGSNRSRVTVTVSDPGYKAIKLKVKL